MPESHTDFIIAVLGEEFGLVGVCLLLVLYLLLISRGLVITAQAQTLYGKLLAGGITMTFFVYVFVNIGMVSGLLPVVGYRCLSLVMAELRWLPCCQGSGF